MNNVVHISFNQARNQAQEQHARDMADVRDMSALGLTLLDFLEKPPAACDNETQIYLTTALGRLKENVDTVRDRWSDIGGTAA